MDDIIIIIAVVVLGYLLQTLVSLLLRIKDMKFYIPLYPIYLGFKEFIKDVKKANE